MSIVTALIFGAVVVNYMIWRKIENEIERFLKLFPLLVFATLVRLRANNSSLGYWKLPLSNFIPCAGLGIDSSGRPHGVLLEISMQFTRNVR
jgi:hypothetical protein